MILHLLPFHIDDLIFEALGGVGLVTTIRFAWWRWKAYNRRVVNELQKGKS